MNEAGENAAREFAWKSARRAMKKADKEQDHDTIVSVWHEFEQYCEANGWPDWWSELERAYTDALMRDTYQTTW
jgi:hypothetical protein